MCLCRQHGWHLEGTVSDPGLALGDIMHTWGTCSPNVTSSLPPDVPASFWLRTQFTRSIAVTAQQSTVSLQMVDSFIGLIYSFHAMSPWTHTASNLTTTTQKGPKEHRAGHLALSSLAHLTARKGAAMLLQGQVWGSDFTAVAVAVSPASCHHTDALSLAVSTAYSQCPAGNAVIIVTALRGVSVLRSHSQCLPPVPLRHTPAPHFHHRQ